MSTTVTDLIDDLADAIDNENAEHARELIEEIGDKYDEISGDEEKRIRQATLLRSNGTQSETDDDLGELVSTSAKTEMKRGAFLIRAVAAVRQIEQNESPDNFDEAVSDVKNADTELETQMDESEGIIQESAIPPSVEIVNLRLNPATVTVEQESEMTVTITNVGDDPADNVELQIDPPEGVTVSESVENLGTLHSEDDETKKFDVIGNESGEQRIRVDVTSENADSDADSKALTVEGADDPSVDDYTDSEGVVRLSGLQEAISDWREADIFNPLLESVTDAWRSQEEIE